jgi:hypothetical protein
MAPHLFTGIHQKKFGGNDILSQYSVNLGCTRGKGSSTRMFNYCKQKSQTPSFCIYQFVTINNEKTSVNNPEVPYNEIEYYSKNFDAQYQAFYGDFQSLIKKYNV